MRSATHAAGGALVNDVRARTAQSLVYSAIIIPVFIFSFALPMAFDLGYIVAPPPCPLCSLGRASRLLALVASANDQ